MKFTEKTKIQCQKASQHVIWNQWVGVHFGSHGPGNLQE